MLPFNAFYALVKIFIYSGITVLNSQIKKILEM